MKFTPASNILEYAEEQREKLAVQFFDAETVAEQISSASGNGFYHLRIAQDKPIDLQHTKYARHLTKALLKAGFKVEWLKCSVWECSGKRQVDARLVFTELSISWGETTRSGGEQATV